jgi:hypothetical protein
MDSVRSRGTPFGTRADGARRPNHDFEFEFEFEFELLGNS